MDIIAHRIRLHEGTAPAHFESWVKEVDYAACRQLPSILAFSVQRVSDEPGAACQYFELISVTGIPDFERDMETPAFQELVAAFDKMACVVEEVSGTRIEPGYTAGQRPEPSSRIQRITTDITDEV